MRYEKFDSVEEDEHRWWWEGVDWSPKITTANDPTPTDKFTVLRDAQQAILDRATKYGTPTKNFSAIAQMWSAYLGLIVTPRDVAMMMVLMKVARDANGQDNDNPVDIAGYAQLAAMLNKEDNGTK